MTPRERYLLETAASLGLLIALRAIPRKTSTPPPDSPRTDTRAEAPARVSVPSPLSSRKDDPDVR